MQQHRQNDVTQPIQGNKAHMRQATVIFGSLYVYCHCLVGKERFDFVPYYNDVLCIPYNAFLFAPQWYKRNKLGY